MAISRLIVFAACFGIFTALYCADDHDHDHPGPPGRPSAGKPQAGGEDGCNASPSRLADFANGERYDFGSVVALITSPACAIVHRQISNAAMNEGVNFTKSGPYRMDQHVAALKSGSAATAAMVDQALGKSIPLALDENPLSSSELLPILGQLSLLSPTAARLTLTTLIRQETESADRKLASTKEGLKPAVAADLAATLLKMGVLDPVVASDLGEAIEDLALTAQADSLGKFFRGLAAAASADAALAPTFNLSATALNRGVKKGKSVTTQDQQARLLQAVFEAVRSSLAASGSLEPGAAELNEAMGSLMNGQPLTLTALRKLWREATRILSASATQTALAEAVAASLTPQLVFLRPDARDLLMQAAANYPILGAAVQQGFVDAWVKAWQRMSERELSLANFNRLKTTYFEPFIPKILDFPPDVIDPMFVRSVSRWGLVKDDFIEKKFPRLFLSQLEKRDKAVKAALADESSEVALHSFADNFAVVWNLHQAHLPVLNRWVKRHEEDK